MIIIYAPEIKRLVDMGVAYAKGETELANLIEVRTTALKFSEQAKERFVNVTKSRIREEESEKMHAVLLENLERRTTLLRSLDEVLENEDTELLITFIKKIEDVSFDIFGIGLAFRDKQAAMDKMSPMPAFDDFIKFAIAVKEDHYVPGELRERLSGIKSHREALENDLKRFKMFYPDEGEIINKFTSGLEQLDKGLAEVQAFITNKNKSILQSGLEKIGESSKTIQEALNEITKARKEKGLSPNPIIDDFLQSVQLAKTGKMPLGDFLKEVDAIKNFVVNLFMSMEEMKYDTPVNATVEKKYSKKFKELKKNLDGLISKARMTSPVLPNFNNISKGIGENLTKLVDLHIEYMKEATKRKDLTSVPALSDLQQAIVGVYKDVVTYTILESQLLNNVTKFQSLYTRMKRLPDGVEELEKLKQGLGRMLEALSVTSSFFTDYDKNRLAIGLETLEDAFGYIANAEEVIATHEQKGVAIQCIKCGFKNSPDEIGCIKCGSDLPEQADAGPDSFEVVLGEHGATIVRDAAFIMKEVEILENLIHSQEAGEAIDEALRVFIEEFTRKINMTLKKNEILILPIVAGNPNDRLLTDHYHAFNAAMERFRKSANEVSLYLIYKDPQYLRSGLHFLKEAQGNMVRVMEEMRRQGAM